MGFTEKPNVQNAKKKIDDALIQLIENKNLEEITVSEITKTACVGKSTFYRYYHDIYDVFEELTDGFANRVLKVMLKLVFSKADGEFEGSEDVIAFETAISLFGLEESDKVVVDYLFRTKDMKTFHMVVERFREVVRNYAEKASLDTEQADYYTKFVMNGLLYSSLDEYKDKGTFSMKLVNLLRSFDIGNSVIRSGDYGV